MMESEHTRKILLGSVQETHLPVKLHNANDNNANS